MNIAIGNDHAGTSYKFEIIKLLESKGHTVNNYGTNEEHIIGVDMGARYTLTGFVVQGSGRRYGWSLWAYVQSSMDVHSDSFVYSTDDTGAPVVSDTRVMSKCVNVDRSWSHIKDIKPPSSRYWEVPVKGIVGLV